MRVYFYEELREMSIDGLLDLLHVYNYLKKDIWELIKLEKDKDSTHWLCLKDMQHKLEVSRRHLPEIRKIIKAKAR